MWMPCTAVHVEDEPGPAGRVEPLSTVFKGTRTRPSKGKAGGRLRTLDLPVAHPLSSKIWDLPAFGNILRHHRHLLGVVLQPDAQLWLALNYRELEGMNVIEGVSRVGSRMRAFKDLRIL